MRGLAGMDEADADETVLDEEPVELGRTDPTLQESDRLLNSSAMDAPPMTPQVGFFLPSVPYWDEPPTRACVEHDSHCARGAGARPRTARST